MPIGRSLGAVQTGADGSVREPPWFTDCQPWQCGAPAQYITAQMRADCPFWGPAGVLGCNSVYCSPSPWCGGATSAPAAGGGGTPTAVPQSTPTAVVPTAAAAPVVPVTAETFTGPIQVSSDNVPGVADQALVPAQVRIPNIWDLLDPTAISQFEYRGVSTSLPVWVSMNYRRSMAPADDGSASGSGNAALDLAAAASAIPWWVWLAIGGAAYYLGDKRKTRRRAHGPK